MAEIKIGDKVYNKLSEINEDYFNTKKKLEEARQLVRQLSRQLKKIVRFYKQNGLDLPDTVVSQQQQTSELKQQ